MARVVTGAAQSARCVAAGCLLALLPLCASAYDVAQVPNVHLQDAAQYVSDPGKILSVQARDSINRMLSRLEQSTGIESAVVMLPTIDDADIFEFAHELFRYWGIGKKKSDNGFLVVFVMDQHKVRFTTGYGLEGTMTDAVSKRIQMQQMVPRFKQSDWDGGMVDGVRAAVRVLDGSMEPEADADDDDIGAVAMAMVLLIVFIMCVVIVAIGNSQKCPRCGKKGLRKTGEQRLKVRVAGGGSKTVLRSTYVCKHCGHVVTKDEDVDDGSGLAAAAVMGSLLGGRGSSGGGFSGGSFGGGSTGGGGATSGW